MSDQITKNFNLSEFDSPDGTDMPDNVEKNVKELAENLQVLRDFLGEPIEINSGYRSPAHNKAVGGRTQSQHLYGKAADIVVGGIEPGLITFVIKGLIRTERMTEGGLSDYNTFTHYDIRGTKARW